ncbi:MAG TPA: flagellar motor switch protein FliG, partial [Desulfobulbus sp.]|nr:flagellar motor switch protein FliG [Desulfobulbus sp.]
MAQQKDKLDGIRRAAILLMCLGEETAARVMREMADDEIFRITRAMAEIDHIPEDVKLAVLSEFELSAESQ